jgi:tetratricopeptide (TPR) repeat protein
MRLRVCSVSLAGLLLMQLVPLAAQQSRPQRGRIPPAAPPSIYELLDQYVTGDVNAPQRFALYVTDKQLRAVEDQSSRWVNANPTTRDKRRLAVAAFILEVAKEWQGTQNWVNARRLISWACHEFGSTTGPPKPGERDWYLASVALLGGAEDWWFLIGKQGFVEGHKPGKAPVDDEVFHGHLAHAAARFPNEPRFALASAVSIESLSWEVGGLGRDPNRRGIVAGEISPEVLAREDKGRSDLWPTATGTPTRRFVNGGPGIPEVRGVARKYAALATALESPVAAEAHIRAGLVSFRIANHEAALGHLQQVPKLSTDPFLVHLSHLIEGIVRERQGQDAGAIAAYRAALQVVPRAQTATTMLVARLMKTGRISEAAEVADSFFDDGPPAPDPWRLYRLGDYRSWPALMARLRAEFQ